MDGRKRNAVLIGNGSYPGNTQDSPPRLPPLRCPEADVAGLKALLEAEPYGGYSVTTLIDRPHQEARRAVYECLKRAGPEDQVVIYYSGHGKQDENGNLYLAGSDTDPDLLDPTAFAAADIVKYVTESRAAARIVILDCCFGGAVEHAFNRGAMKGEVADQASQAIRKLEGKGIFYLTASTDTQTAEEKDSDKYSLLTKHIIAGIRDGKADADDDGAVSFSELCSFVQEKVRLEGVQRPLSYTMRAYGDPIVALTGQPALTARRDAIVREIYELCRKEMLDDGDAAEVLNRIRRPAAEPIGHETVQSMIEALYASRSDPRRLVKTIHTFVNLSQMPEAPPVGKMEKPVGLAAAVKGDALRWPRQWKALTAAIATTIVVILAVGAYRAWSPPSAQTIAAASDGQSRPATNAQADQQSSGTAYGGPVKLITPGPSLLTSPGK